MNRYSVGGKESEFVDADKQVLTNKKGIVDMHTLYVEEEEGLVHAYDILTDEVKADTYMTCELIKYIHTLIFGEIYEWAGKWRTVTISKDTTTWPPPDYLDEGMRRFEAEVLHAFPADAMNNDHEFCHGISMIQGEFLSIHPFREGNARTIKVVTDLLALQTHRPPLVYDTSKAGINEYINAAKAAMLKDYDPLYKVIADALKRAS